MVIIRILFVAGIYALKLIQLKYSTIYSVIDRGAQARIVYYRTSGLYDNALVSSECFRVSMSNTENTSERSYDFVIS